MANVAPDFLAPPRRRLGEEPPPELVLQYVYAVLYSPPYRRRYAELLRTDFPRIPLPRDRGAFLELAGWARSWSISISCARTACARPAVRFEGKEAAELARARRRKSAKICSPPSAASHSVNEEREPLQGSTRSLGLPHRRLPCARPLVAEPRRWAALRRMRAFPETAAALAITVEVRRRIDEWGVCQPQEPAPPRFRRRMEAS